MRSLTTFGGWAQPKGSSPPTAQEMAEEMKKAESEGEKPEEKKKKKKKKDGTVKEKKKKKKDGTIKEKKKPKENKDMDGSGTLKKSTKGEKAQTTRISTSSFEIGHLSASPEELPATVSKKHSILGLGLPSAMRLPRMRGGSTASSINLNAVSSPAQSNPDSPPSSAATTVSSCVSQPSRLSVENLTSGRKVSVSSSNQSSLRPVSVASSNSRLSTGSSVLSAASGTSVKWGEQCLETVREQRRKEREERRISEDSATSGDKAEKRTSKESRRSSEGRRRTPLSSIFPEVQHHQIGTAMLKEVVEEPNEITKDMTAAARLQSH